MSEDFAVLKDILDDFRRETGELEARIEQVRQHIRETDVYVAGLVESETEDFKVFSPRKAEVIYKEELKDARESKAECEIEMGKLCLRRDLLADYIERLEAVLKCLEQERRLQVREAADLQKQSMEKFAHLAQGIESVCNNMEKRPLQAKQDLAIIARNLREATEKIENTVWIEGK